MQPELPVIDCYSVFCNCYWAVVGHSLTKSHIYDPTASKIFVRHKKQLGSGSNFCVFFGMHFEKCFDSSEPPYKRTPKSSMAIVKLIYFISQHKALYIDPCTLSSQKSVGRREGKPLRSAGAFSAGGPTRTVCGGLVQLCLMTENLILHYNTHTFT